MRDAGTITTKKLYDEDAYAVSFCGIVEAVNGNEVVLDQTLFFPEEGGQSSDKGMLGGFPVRDVRIKGGVIRHILDVAEERREEFARIFREGNAVEGTIDWDERFSNMQQHSGEHLFSGIVMSRFGLTNVGFHLSAREVTLDFDGVLTAEELLGVEDEVNRAIALNIASVIRHTTPEERASIPYRSKLELEGDVRLVEFPGYDLCACCAPHVRRTGEIGILKIVNVMKYKGGIRVNILCGRRALGLFRRDHELLNSIAVSLSTSCEESVGQVLKMKDEIRRLRAALRDAAVASLLSEMERIPKEDEDAVLFKQGLDAEDAREAVNAMMKLHPGCCAVFTGSDEEGYSFVMGSGSLDCRRFMNAFKNAFDARGGGKPEMIRGAVAGTEAAIREVIAAADRG